MSPDRLTIDGVPLDEWAVSVTPLIEAARASLWAAGELDWRPTRTELRQWFTAVLDERTTLLDRDRQHVDALRRLRAERDRAWVEVDTYRRRVVAAEDEVATLIEACPGHGDGTIADRLRAHLLAAAEILDELDGPADRVRTLDEVRRIYGGAR